MVICVIRPRLLLSLKSVKNCGTKPIITLLSIDIEEVGFLYYESKYASILEYNKTTQ